MIKNKVYNKIRKKVKLIHILYQFIIFNISNLQDILFMPNLYLKLKN